MSLEQAILDRLEKRNAQIAQLQSTVQALERAADVEREHARQQLAQQNNEINGLRQLVNEKMTINAQLSEQITAAWLEREQMQNQISELLTERDRIREITKSLVPKSALKQAVQEAAELRAEVVKLRAEVQPESQVDTLERQANGLRAEMASLANQLMDANAEASGIRGHANSWGCKEGETVKAFMQRQSMELAEAKTDLAETVTLSNAKTLEIRKLMDGHAEDMKAQAELLSKYESLLAKTTDLGSYAMTLGRKEGEPLEMFMERQALRLAALESEAGPTHSSIDWQVVARNLEQTVAGLNAKVAELEAQGAYATKVASQLGERIAYVQKQSMALETLVMRIKSYRNTEAVQQCALIHQLIDATLETMGTRLTA